MIDYSYFFEAARPQMFEMCITILMGMIWYVQEYPK